VTAALITGAIRGVGLGIAEELASAGMDVIVQDRHPQGRQLAVRESLLAAGARDVHFAFFDLSDREDCRAGFEEIATSHRVDILVNNAGIQVTADLKNLSRDEWDRVIAVNLSAAFESMAVFLPLMAERGYGRVVNIASTHGLVASPRKAAYVAAKHGLVGLTKVAALEYATAGSEASGGVTVNAICPGWTETELIEPQIQERASVLGLDRDSAATHLLAEKQPTLRFTQTSEVGKLVRFLSSPEMHNLTGVAIPIDGGWVAR